MSTNSARRFVLLSGVMALACATMVAAQDTAPPGSTPSAGLAPGVHMTHTFRTETLVTMRGMHTVPATVTDTDPKTGMVDVMAGGIALRVQFPPTSMATLKAGDKIGLYMAYSQATVAK